MTPAIRKKLAGVKGRLRTQMFVCHAAQGLAFGALAAALIMILSKFTLLDIDLIYASWLLLIAGTVIGGTVGLVRPLTVFDAAFACDVHLGLKERLTTALEFSDREENPLVPALIADASRHATRIRPTRDFPLRTPRELLYAVILIALTAGLYFVPPWQYVFASEEKKEELAEVQAEAERVREIAREITINPPAERNDLAQEIARELQELARDMDFGTLSRREALERLSALEEKIEQSQEGSGYNELSERLDQMAQALARSGDLRQAAQALQDGDAESARQALEQLGNDLESGRVPIENLNDLADSLDQAISSLGNDPSTAELRDNLARARDELRAAAQGAGQGAEMDPAEMAQALIGSINRALPEVDALDIPQDVRDRAREIMESVRDDLQAALDRGEVSSEDVERAQERLQEVRRMLEEAGVDFDGEDEEQRSEEEVAQELLEEAQRLENLASSMSELDSETRSQCQSTCQSVASELENRISQSTCSADSNAEARRKLDEVRRQLQEQGATEEQCGNRSQCNSGSSRSSQEGAQQGGSRGAGMQSLFGMGQGNQGQGRQGQGQGREGQSGMPGPGQACSGAGRAIKDAGQCLGQFGPQLNAGRCFKKVQRRICASRSSLSGCQGGQSGGSRAHSSWGTGSSPYAVAPAPLTPGHQNDPSIDPSNTNADVLDYQELYQPGFKPHSTYETQLEGKFTDAGGSYVFVEVADPDTGETSYVPYFTLEPTDVTALMDAIEDQDIPRSYADLVRLYFEQLAAGGAVADESTPEE